MKTFTLNHKVYFSETNAVGGVVYFSNYVKWQGMAREEYFVSSVPEWKTVMEDVSKGRLNMLTVEEHSHFLKHVCFGDEVFIALQTANIRRYSFEMVFKMFSNTLGNLIYEGWQKLAFDDFKGNFVSIPEPMLKSVLSYEAKEGNYIKDRERIKVVKQEKLATH